jgi:TetR/AcrR family transcriptional regulator, repressor for uid operon
MRTRDHDLNAERRQTILKAAGDCFVQNGFHATSMKDVCTAAGMSPGTLYHYFRSKADIIAGIIDEDALAVRKALDEVAEAPDLLNALFEALDAFAMHMTDRDLILHAEISAEILRRPDLKQRAAAAHLADQKALAGAILKAQDAGTVPREIDGAQTAADILSLIDGMLWEATLHGAAVLKSRTPTLRRSIMRLLGQREQQS